MPESHGSSGQPVPRGYPRHWEADVVLRDGTTAVVRPIRPSDADALQRFHVEQSERSIYFRFFAPKARLTEDDLTRFTVVDHHDRVALIVTEDVESEDVESADGQRDTTRIWGVGRFDAAGDGSAEVAFNIADHAQGRGLGSILLEHLAAVASEVGISRFTADVLPSNGKMLAIFREAGYHLVQGMSDGVYSVSINLDPTERSRTVMADREHHSDARSIQSVLHSEHVTVVVDDSLPADSTARALAQATLNNLRSHSHGITINAVPSDFNTLADAPEPLGLVVLSGSTSFVTEAVGALAHRGATGGLVLSKGFTEPTDTHFTAQRELLRAARKAGVRLLGPGSAGLLLTSTTQTGTVRTITVTAVPVTPATPVIHPNVGVFTQSAASTAMIASAAAHTGLNLRSLISAGQRADVSGNDLMQFWVEDDETHVAALYLESLGNARKFVRVARRLARLKPVIVATTSDTGQMHIPGHAVRTSTASHATLDDMFRQCGVIRATDPQQLIDFAQAFATQPLPATKNVQVIASSPALAAIVESTLTSAGLALAGPSIVVETSSPADIREIVSEIFGVGHNEKPHSRPTQHSVIIADIPVLHSSTPGLAEAVEQVAHGVTTVRVTMDTEASAIPTYRTVEAAVATLRAMVEYVQWREREVSLVFGAAEGEPSVDRAAARALVHRWGSGELNASQASELLQCYGLTLWPSRTVDSAEKAVAAAHALGWPVALKSTAPILRHRADLGSVRLEIASAEELELTYQAMRALLTRQNVSGHEAPLEVQSMAPMGVACVVTTTEDELFGPLVSFGLAGDAIDLLGDISVGIAPLTVADINTLITSVRAAPRLHGYRGLPPVDLAALADVIGRLGLLADDLPEVKSLIIHPMVASPQGAAILSARIILETSDRFDGPRRALPSSSRALEQ